jgi:hypothetical protein
MFALQVGAGGYVTVKGAFAIGAAAGADALT